MHKRTNQVHFGARIASAVIERLVRRGPATSALVLLGLLGPLPLAGAQFTDPPVFVSTTS